MLMKTLITDSLINFILPLYEYVYVVKDDGTCIFDVLLDSNAVCTCRLGAGVADYRLGDRCSIPAEDLTSVPRPALRPTHPPIQWVPAILSRG
jgi:hypothetical protein